MWQTSGGTAGNMSEKAAKPSRFKLTKLPSVVLGKILRMLSTADRETLELVSKNWRSRFHYRSLRSRRLDKKQRMEFFKKRTYESGSLELFLLAWERRIIMKCKKIMSPAFLQHHTAENYNVRTISMNNVNITLKDLKELLVRCPRLKLLHLHAINLNEDVCRAIGENLKELSILTLNWSTNIGDGINLILQGCRKLKFVRLSSRIKSTWFRVGELPESICSLKCEKSAIASDEDFNTLVDRCPSIEVLSCGIIEGSFTEKTIEILCRLKNLKNLNLWFSKISVPALDFSPLNEMSSLKNFRLKDTKISCEEFARIQASIPCKKFSCRVKKIALAEKQNNSVGTSPDPVEIITIESSQDSSGTDFSDGEQRPKSSSCHASRTQASSSGVEVARQGKKRRRSKRKKSINRLVPNLRNVKQELDFTTEETVGGPFASCKTEKMEPIDQNGSKQEVGMENAVVKLEPFPQRIKQEQDVEVMETAPETS